MSHDADPRGVTPDRFARLRRALGSDDRLPIDPDLSPDDAAEPSITHEPSTSRRRRPAAAELVAILAGGLLGTLGRYGVDRAWPTPHGDFPMSTFIVNASGAFALGLVLTLILERRPGARHLREFGCVGVLGSWTTMSTLATEADVLVKGGAAPVAALYVGASLLTGLVAVAVGIALGRRRALST
jgi:fluoride exporter